DHGEHHRSHGARSRRTGHRGCHPSAGRPGPSFRVIGAVPSSEDSRVVECSLWEGRTPCDLTGSWALSGVGRVVAELPAPADGRRPARTPLAMTSTSASSWVRITAASPSTPKADSGTSTGRMPPESTRLWSMIPLDRRGWASARPHRQVPPHEGDVSRLDGHVGAHRTHRDARVCRGQTRDAQLPYVVGDQVLRGRADPGQVTNAELLSDVQ